MLIWTDWAVAAVYAGAFGGLSALAAILRAGATARHCQVCGDPRSWRDRAWARGLRCRPCREQVRLTARRQLEPVYRMACTDAWDRCLRGARLRRRVGWALYLADLARDRVTANLTPAELDRLVLVLARVRDEEAEQEVAAHVGSQR